jgi:hypothetical protein
MAADGAQREAVFAQVRAYCLALPGTHERTSHGSPWFFVGSGRGRGFVVMLDRHHGDAGIALWCAAPRGAQEAYVTRSPEQYFVPPYVGPRGWLGVRLDHGLPWDEVAGAIEDAYVAIAPAKLLEQLPPVR